MDVATLPGTRVAWDPSLAGWTVASYDLVRQVLRDTDRFTSEGGAIAENLGPEALLVTDSPVHEAVRAIWAKPFVVGAVVAQRAELEALASSLLAPVLSELRRGETVDIVPMLEAFAGKVVLGLMNFSQPREDDFRRWYKIILDSAAFSITADHRLHHGRSEAKAQVYGFLETEVLDRLDRLAGGERPNDLIGLIAEAEGQAGITRSVTLDNLFNVFIGGADTTVRWMGNAIVLFHRHPDTLAELRINPVLLPQALEEVMRIESVTRFAVRTVRADRVELDGHALARGDTVYLLGSVANRDPAAFDDPDRFDIHRKAKPHLGFSHGIHQCIGMNLARVEAQALLGALLAPTAPPLDVVEVDYGDDSVVRGPQRLLLRRAI
jgi:cytochrome P450